MTLVYIFLFVFSNFDWSQGSVYRQSPSDLIQGIVNSKNDCHIHIVNPNEDRKFQVIGGMKYPRTINSRCNEKFGFRVERVKGLNCVILLVVKFSDEVASCNGLDVTVTNFAVNFMVMRKEAYFIKYEANYFTIMSRSSSMLLVTSRTVNDVSFDWNYIFFGHGFRFSRVTLVYYEKGKQFDNHFRVYTLCRFCGNKGPLLVSVDVSVEKQSLEWLTSVPYYNEKVFYFISWESPLFEYTSQYLVEHQEGPWIASKQISPNLLDSSSDTNRLSECYTLLEIVKHLNATVGYFYHMTAPPLQGDNIFSVMGILSF